MKAMWKNMQKPDIMDWLLIGAILVFCFISFNHTDLTWTATHGKNLVELAIKGDIASFYDYCQGEAYYPIATYIIFAIWSIPIFIICTIFNLPLWGAIDYAAMGFKTIMWYKILPVLFFFATAYIIYKIGFQLKMSKNKSKWMAFMWISFPIAVYSQFVFGQYDSIWLFFTMLAILFYLKKQYYKTSIFMAIAISFKIFPIFIFIPMVLLVEKRVLHIVKHLGIGVSLWAVSKALFSHSVAFASTDWFNQQVFNRMISVGINTDFGVASFFVIGMIAICTFAYIHKVKDDFEFYKLAMYIPLAVFSILFAFILWHPYWLLMVSIFIVIVAFQNNNLKLAMFYDIALSASLMIVSSFFWPETVGANLINKGIFPVIFGIQNTVKLLYPIYTLNNFLNIGFYMSIFVAVLLLNLVIYYPSKKNIRITKKMDNDTIDVPRSYVWARALSIFVYILPTIWLYFSN